ncbi:MAG: hypothetical protein BIFFINMI_00292 [Phycisphaerae bacterium]|nr:hypothetical protein [Phycisphaerae bacterium]
MKSKVLIYGLASLGVCLGVAGALVGVFWGFASSPIPRPVLSPGVVVTAVVDPGLQAELEKTIASATARRTTRSGLSAALGGTHLKVSSAKPVEVLLPIPQLADAQVPICLFLKSTPSEAVQEFRLRQTPNGNVVVNVRLKGGDHEARIAWSSVVLLASRSATPNPTPAEPYRAASPCAQADADAVATLAAKLWPASGQAAEFAVNIQRHVAASTKKEQPRSFDAVEILRSGDSGVCTGNANLAAALFRSRGLACRSMAVIAVVPMPQEMHRIVEFHEDGRWVPFDPSGLYPDIPAQPWQYVIMAKTTVSDEAVAMQPRYAVTPGSPYGQEIEMLTPGVSICGQDYFWTTVKPLAEFEPTQDAVRLAAEAWSRYVETGTLTPGQLRAAAAQTANAFAEAWRSK